MKGELRSCRAESHFRNEYENTLCFGYNAHEDLKKIAIAVIPSNDEDGVAKWLEKNVALG